MKLNEFDKISESEDSETDKILGELKALKSESDSLYKKMSDAASAQIAKMGRALLEDEYIRPQGFVKFAAFTSGHDLLSTTVYVYLVKPNGKTQWTYQFSSGTGLHGKDVYDFCNACHELGIDFDVQVSIPLDARKG